MLKVILADDEKRICRLLQLIVDWNALGFEIAAVVHNGLDALAAVRELQPDVVITDIRMPECSGLELLRHLREEKRDIDVVIISGYRQFDYAHAALQDGAEDYLLKPIKKAELTAVLQRIRERRQSSDEVQEQLGQIQDIRHSLAVSADKLHTQLVLDILNGKLSKSTEERLRADYQYDFPGDQRWFAAIKIDAKEALLEKTNEVVGRKMLEIARSELVHGGYPNCSAIYENYIYCIIDVAVSNGEDAALLTLQDTLYHIIREMQDYAGKVARMHISIGVSRVKNEDFAFAAACCRAAARDQVFRGTEKVLYYEAPAGYVDASAVVNHKTAVQIRDAMIKGDGCLREVLNTILDELHHGEYIVQSGENLYEILEKMVEQMIACAETAYPEAEPREILDTYLHKLCMCYSWDSYRRYFRELCGELTDAVQQMRKGREKRPVQEAKRIMDERFREDLSLAELSGLLNLSPTYFSALFKTETGMTASQYLTNVRMKEAKRLLLATRDSIACISAQIGYNDEKYFMRVFKKEIGLTVSEFRRLYG
ncbi:MAG: response regulator [Dysosmobacter sp.]|nr:response regulator [Dysosmobacter sp.]